MREIADTIERDIARALRPKPEKVYEILMIAGTRQRE